MINEIHYNSPGSPDTEFVELVNAGPAPIDLDGWYLLDDNDDADRCLLFGTVPPGGFWVVPGRRDLFTTTYPTVRALNPNGCDSALPGSGFGWSNAGDRVRLFAPDDSLADRVDYLDAAPWPPEADGDGSSLELRNPLLDNTAPENWAASTQPTPGQQNGAFIADLPPDILSVERIPALPQPGEPVTIRAFVFDDGTVPFVGLTVAFGDSDLVTRLMADDGLSDDGAAGDGLWAITLEPAPAETLVRYSVVATDDAGQSSVSPPGAPLNYEAYTVGYRPQRLRITEILASNQAGILDPGGSSDDWVEITNLGTAPVTLGQRFLSDDPDRPRRWSLPNVALAPAQTALIWADDETFQGPFHAPFRLSRAGGWLGLFDAVDRGNGLIHGFSFGPQSPDVSYGLAPVDAEGLEYLEQPTPTLSNDGVTRFSAVCINEFLSGSQIGLPDWIELYNRSMTTVDISGWGLSDDVGTPARFVFPPNTTIGPGGFLSVDATTLGFGLSNAGIEQIVLTDGSGQIGYDYVDYGAQLDDITWGRVPDGAPYWQFLPPSRELSNRCPQGLPTAPGAVEKLRFANATTLAWEPTPGASAYDVLSGSLDGLRAFVDLTMAQPACLWNNSRELRQAATEIPPPGAAFFYLIRAVDDRCGYGTWQSSLGAEPPRDESLAQDNSICP